MPHRPLQARRAALALVLDGLGALAVGVALALGTTACSRAPAAREEVMLAAAASLRAVLPELIRAYEGKRPGLLVAATYGASGDLKKQVEGGAPIDGVIFASGKPVDELVRGGYADGESRAVLARNRLVLVGPSDPAQRRALTFATLGQLPAGEKIAIGDPGAVPAGQYARDFLQTIGAWKSIEGRAVLGGDVAAVLTYARRGEVAAAIVYATDARGMPELTVLDEAREDAPRVEVVGAVVTGAKASRGAKAFLAFVASSEGQSVLGSFGFLPP
jgi:molybdate transport system substrate-binding protein